MGSQPRSLRERRQDHKRQRIIEAAQEVVRSHGMEQLSLRLIAEQLGVTAASLYRYFESKKAIISALRVESQDRLRGLMEQIPSELTAGDRLVELGMRYLEFAKAEPVLFKFAFLESPSDRTGLHAPNSADSPFRLLLETIESAAAAGVLRPELKESKESLAYSIWSLAHGMAVLEATHLHDFRADFAVANRLALRLLVDGMTAPHQLEAANTLYGAH